MFSVPTLDDNIWYNFWSWGKWWLKFWLHSSRTKGGKICKYFANTAWAANAQIISDKFCLPLPFPFDEQQCEILDNTQVTRYVNHELSHLASSIEQWDTFFRAFQRSCLKTEMNGDFQVHINIAWSASPWFQQQDICIQEREEKVLLPFIGIIFKVILTNTTIKGIIALYHRHHFQNYCHQNKLAWC